MKNNIFKVGDDVLVDNNNNLYSSYCQIASLMGLTGYKKYESPKTNTFKIIAECNHLTEKNVVLFGLRDDEGNEFIFSNKGGHFRFAPRTKVEYVKVDKKTSIFSLYDEFVKDKLFSFDKKLVTNEVYLMALLTSDLLYRRKETPYTWLDEVSEYVDSIAKAADEIKDEELITIEGTFTREQLVKLGEIVKG